MKSRICIGGEWVSAPKFAIGDAVVHCYQGLNDDENSPKKWHTLWYRGVVIGSYYNRTTKPRTGWYVSGWIYVIEIESCSDGDALHQWTDITEEFPEADLQPSRQLARLNAARCRSEKEHHHSPPPPLVSIARCKAG